MGLGTKIKVALSGDKDNLGSRRRKTTDPYPNAAIPRSNTATTWQTTQTSPDGAKPDAKPESIAEDDGNEYTHTLADVKKTDNQDERLRELNKQHPYWGDSGKAATEDFAARNDKILTMDSDSGIAAVDRDDEEADDFETPGAQETGAYKYPIFYDGDLRNQPMPQTSDRAGRDEHTNGFNAPMNNVNRGRPVLVDDEAAQVNSMAASQLSQSQPADHINYNGGQMYSNNAGYGTHKFSPTYGIGEFSHDKPLPAQPNVDGRGYEHAMVSPQSRAERPYSPEQVPAQNLTKTGTGLSDGYYTRPEDASNGQAAGLQTNFGGGHNDTFPTQAVNQGQRSSPVTKPESSNGDSPSKSAADHYGPGHAAARVLHRCQHCGNDNDITKYFSKDVVYRLS